MTDDTKQASGMVSVPVEPTMAQWDDFCAVFPVRFSEFYKAYTLMISRLAVQPEAPTMNLKDETTGDLAGASSGNVTDTTSKALIDVLSERRRQVEVEGWTTEHDDNHSTRDMARAAACYLEHYIGRTWVYEQGNHDDYRAALMPDDWPWEDTDWKPKDPRRDLVRATALGLAEIERWDRAAGEGQSTVAATPSTSNQQNEVSASPRSSDAGEAADAARYRWAFPILTGSDDKTADRRALALASALVQGLAGDAAIDAAMSTTSEPK